VTATITDLFCGAGGSSLGAHMAGATGRLALNHWDRAIETHSTNFPEMDHDQADVSALTTARIRNYPHTDILIASPECTNHSLAKGAQRRKPRAASLFEDGPAGDAEQDRSRATMWDVARFAEQKELAGHPYKAIIVENVVDAFKWGPDDNGALFQAWLSAIRAIGYDHQVVFLNSMFAGAVPQSRDRMYVVFTRNGVRRPDLRVTPPSWCAPCEQIVPGVQSFKKLDYIWGRYGPQYFYTCPECRGTVIPGAHPAATAIDWTLPAERIGDRARPLASNTRKRIRRGLEKLLGEPFAVRLTHGKTPRPLTLPLVTLTTRHDMAMVMPVAGNTHESTPGNRARNAADRPLDTVHGTLDRALVMANTENNVPRPADREPTQTLRTEGGLAMVMANRANNVGEAAEEAATPPVLTGGHLAVVMRNNTARGDEAQMSTPVHEPTRTFTANGAPQSIVIPYQSGNEPGLSGQDPTPTLTTRDRIGMVVPMVRNGRARDVDIDVVPTMATEGPPAMVEVKLTEDDIDNCRFRMFDLHEIAAAMAIVDHVDGSPYVVTGNKRERMAQYGNAVTPPAMELLVGRVLEVIA